MKRPLDLLRAIIISPEVITALIPIAVYSFWTDPANLVAAEITKDMKWGIGLTIAPVTFGIAAYTLGTEVLSPHGTRRIMLDWPDYPMLKSRVLLTLGFCACGFLLGVGGFYVIAQQKSAFGATLLFSGLFSSGVSLVTLGLAKWKIREIFRE
jgi:hypothetical protein